MGKGGWTGFIWLRIQKMAGSCEYDNEYLDSIKCGIY
jgi:hypothetical protein